MHDAVDRYRTASEANDVEAVAALLAPDVELVSPLSANLVFRGAEDVRTLFTLVYGTLRGLRWTDHLADGARHVLLGEARVAGLRVTDAMVFELAPDGRIRRIRPHLRPWLATTVFALLLGPKAARHPGMLLRAARR